MRSIVVSVCAKTADELIQQIKKAEEFGDVIEVRFDCLDVAEVEKSLANFPAVAKPVIATFRPIAQGGAREISEEESKAFWQGAARFAWVDLGPGPAEKIAERISGKKICSHHDFTGVPGDLSGIYDSLKASEAEVLKIAVQMDDISDGLPLWSLLKKAKAENKQLVPIAMGEAGKWTRILGLAYGAPMTYAALETGKEVAPGQISAADLRDVYRVKELNEQTEIYGVIGDPVKFSLSPYMQNAGFKAAAETDGLNAVFIPFEVKDLDRFIKRFLPESGLNIRGLSVTIPHKQAIMKYLDQIDETARKIGAVNTVKIVDGKLLGFNTDAPGFIKPLKKAYGELSGAKAAIIGAGGGARAVIYALQKEGAEVTVFARDTGKAEGLAGEFEIALKKLQDIDFTGFDIVINATPLGMKGKFEGQTPSTSSQLNGISAAYDLVYIPEETPFISSARTADVPIVIGGTEMLVAQGAEQFRIWTGNNATPEIVEIMHQAVRKKLR
ncbi:MAG TPA: shikimate dehydrogenase [Pyrinomonadaceae bacterium]|jgi:3-dehydroquinate dehydratase/shikimate dehydrogenase|nr:shikimate dehydrogenase [Pyrinomonadaceae bacterium]